MFQVISSLLPVSNWIFGEKSQKIDLNRIIRQRFFRFFENLIFPDQWSRLEELFSNISVEVES